MKESSQRRRQLTSPASIKRRSTTSDVLFVGQAVLVLWAYSTACSALALGLPRLVGLLTGETEAAWVRFGTIGAAMVAAGINGPSILRFLEPRRSARTRISLDKS